MAALPQFDYLFAIGTIFSFLDAWNIGMLFPAHKSFLCVLPPANPCHEDST